MREREVFVLLDEMLEACRNATFFIRGMCEEEFLSDIRTQQAVAMSLVIIGEAAARWDAITPFSSLNMPIFRGGT